MMFSLQVPQWLNMTVTWKEYSRGCQNTAFALNKKSAPSSRILVEYLGHHCMGANGVHTTREKTQAILEAPESKIIRELRSFLGLLDYYTKFIPNLASLLYPLHELLKKDCRWQRIKKCSEVFVEAKNKMTSAPILAH